MEKWGYDKEWTWDDDTALVAAAREGHAHVVAELLVRGANLHHRSCPEDDLHECFTQGGIPMIPKSFSLIPEADLKYF